NSVDLPTLGRPMMAIVNGMAYPCAFSRAPVNERSDQRVKVPPGSGAGKGDGDCWTDWAAGAAACGGGVFGSGGGAVVRLRAIFFGFGGGGVEGCSVAGVSPSASAGAAAWSAAAGCLPLPFLATCLGSGGGCSATGGTSCCCCAPLYNSFG